MDYFKGIDEILNNFAREIQDNFKETLSWTSNLKNNVKVTTDGQKIFISIPLYGLVIDEGRRPGAKMPPPHALDEWLKKNSIPLEAAFPIARAIGKRGIPAKPFIDDSIEIDRLANDVAKLVADNIILSFE